MTAEDIVYIVKWVMPSLERVDIHDIVDSRLQGDFSTASAWKALETAMAWVTSIGMQRPNMDQVLADLKECLTLGLAREQAKQGAQQGSTSLNQTFDRQTSEIVSVDSEFHGPGAR